MIVTFLFLARAFFFFLLSGFAFELMALAGTSVPAIYVFGDSLVDVGNNNYILDASMDVRADYPHNGIDFPGQIPTGRFSNGYIGIDFLAQAMGFEQSPPPFLSLTNEEEEINLMGLNFASAGSGILDTTGLTGLSLTAQIANFEFVRGILVRKFGKKAALIHLSKSLFLISSGSNDLFAYSKDFGSQSNTTMAQLFLTSLALKLEDDLKKLYDFGARKFGIYGLSLAGCVPFLRSKSLNGECLQEINDMALQFNQVAKARLQPLSSLLPGFMYSYFNFLNSSASLQSNANSYGFKELRKACCGSGRYNGERGCTPDAIYCKNRDEYYFWDNYHPTQKACELGIMRAYNGSQEFTTPVNIKQLVESDDTLINSFLLPA